MRTYTLDCIEKDMPWDNSLIKYFEEKAAAGLPVLLQSIVPQRKAITGLSVYVTSISWAGFDSGTANVRKFMLVLQEA